MLVLQVLASTAEKKGDSPPLYDTLGFANSETSHNKADCPKPRVFKGTCRICSKEGHPAAECPDKPPVKCRNCKEEGHEAAECKNNRKFDNHDALPQLTPDEAWEQLAEADKTRDLDMFRKASLCALTSNVQQTNLDTLGCPDLW